MGGGQDLGQGQRGGAQVTHCNPTDHTARFLALTWTSIHSGSMLVLVMRLSLLLTMEAFVYTLPATISNLFTHPLS